jgi:hypothetical protein
MKRASTAPGVATNIAAQQRLDSFGTVRARLGVLPTDRLLVYGTGGFAYGRIKENVTLTSAATVGVVNVAGDFNCTAGQTCFAGSSSRVATGWTAGFGTEYAFSSNITAKVEYAYVNLGGGDVVNVVAVAPTAGSRPSAFSATYGRMDFNAAQNLRYLRAPQSNDTEDSDLDPAKRGLCAESARARMVIGPGSFSAFRASNPLIRSARAPKPAWSLTARAISDGPLVFV